MRSVKRNTTLGFVVSLHLAVFTAAAYPPNTAAALGLGGASTLVLGASLFYELAV